MKKIISILLVALVIGCFGMEAKTTKKSYRPKSRGSSKVNTKVTQTGSRPTNFTVGSKVVKIPSLNSFLPLLKHFPRTSRKVKSIKICYMTDLRGVIMDDLEDFTKATTLREAKKVYSTYVLTFDFNKNQQIVFYEHYTGSDRFKYDNNGYLTTIIDEEWGYKWSAAFKVRYNIEWKNGTPISINRDIIEFEFGDKKPNDENPPFNLDIFPDPIVANMLAMLKSNTTKVKTQQNTCRISGLTIIDNEFFRKGDKIVYWVEVQYY